MTPAADQRPKSLRAPRLYPSADRVLAVYYALRMDWIAQSAQCDGSPVTSSKSGGLPSSAVAFMCDVGSVIEAALTQYERDEVLPRRWYAFFRSQFAAGEQRRLHNNVTRYGRRDSAYKLAHKAETIAKWDRESWDAECDRLSRRKAYREAMRKLESEMRARDLYARAMTGGRAAIPAPPEWTA